MAKKTPEDIDVEKRNDVFEIIEVVKSEDIGFFNKGEGAKAAVDGLTEIGGKIPINPSGGLKAREHPLGATDIAQVIELVWQSYAIGVAEYSIGLKAMGQIKSPENLKIGMKLTPKFKKLTDNLDGQKIFGLVFKPI